MSRLVNNNNKWGRGTVENCIPNKFIAYSLYVFVRNARKEKLFDGKDES